MKASFRSIEFLSEGKLLRCPPVCQLVDDRALKGAGLPELAGYRDDPIRVCEGIE